jgi:hypothetical protein
MDEEAKKEVEDEEWERRERERRERDEERTRKNREKRSKKRKGRGGEGGDRDQSQKKDVGTNGNGDTPINKKGALQVPRRGSRDEAEQGSDFGVADLVKEVGITIHEDD